MVVEEVTKALDEAISKTARHWFEEHKSTVGDSRAAAGLIHGYQEIRKLVTGGMPVYWYQAPHINMAYTTALQLLEQSALDCSTDRPLHTYDFGCGALATQFGLSLAVTERVGSTTDSVDISIKSVDESVVMEAIGWRVWHEFRLEIGNKAKYPHLDVLRQVCESLVFNRSVQYTGETWVTAHHVVYQENHADVTKQLSELTRELNPQYVLMTTRSRKEDLLPQASALGMYTRYSFERVLTDLRGPFEKTNGFRAEIRDFLVTQAQDQLDKSENSFILPYLRNGTRWILQQGPYSDPPLGVYYERDGQTSDNPLEDDLPF
ncbi:MAG: hypothetical protein F4X20_01820 [Dehalococcoidia bacterium]|nr:hypothetical protein [Dehalococcoidia bacterium]